MTSQNPTPSCSDNTYNALGLFHKISQLRADSWSSLGENLAYLSSENSAAQKEGLTTEVKKTLRGLEAIETFSAFPSKKAFGYFWELFNAGSYQQLDKAVTRVVRSLQSESFRRHSIDLCEHDAEAEVFESSEALTKVKSGDANSGKPYFELLIVDSMSIDEEEAIRYAFRKLRSSDDNFVYDIVTVPSFEDAVIAILTNPNIQACMIRFGFPYKSKIFHGDNLLRHYLKDTNPDLIENKIESERSLILGSLIRELRPELDLYLVASRSAEKTASQGTTQFTRIFYRETAHIEQHHIILSDIFQRYQTPFFDALRDYSKKPTGVFHALPLSRGKSITKAHWVDDMMDFYGRNLFLAETSTTSCGLDSLLQPTGALKKAQKLASRAFGSRQTFFVTNGTSTANKIVVQTLIQPGDIVLVDRSCHKSHHYGLVLAGAHVCYLDSYPLNNYSMYGGVPIREVKRTLLEYKRNGILDRVKMILLTNCTFDGIVYNVRQVMEECLAIKPDLVFLWDEAWFAFASFSPTYRHRTGMHAARTLESKFQSDDYRQEYEAHKLHMTDKTSDEDNLNNRLIPDPDKARIRVYTTQSTHKTLTAMRQGSMIHIHDQDYHQKAKTPFMEAYMTHTSTSPNYQVLASLDVGRRQAELEGFDLVQKQLELAISFRERLHKHSVLNKYFRVLSNNELIPNNGEMDNHSNYYNPVNGWDKMEDAWLHNEFAIDPCRITLYIGDTGIDGNTFKNNILMDQYGIQINKTSRNTILLMFNIGTTRGVVSYLLDVLVKIAKRLEQQYQESSRAEKRIIDNKIHSLTKELPPLPDFSYFHPAFRFSETPETRNGDLRKAFFLSYNDDNCEYIRIDNGELQNEIAKGRETVSAAFVTPYPPGFPVLVPGQVVSQEILSFLLALDVKEIHGYRPELGLNVFTEATIKKSTDE